MCSCWRPQLRFSGFVSIAPGHTASKGQNWNSSSSQSGLKTWPPAAANLSLDVRTTKESVHNTESEAEFRGQCMALPGEGQETLHRASSWTGDAGRMVAVDGSLCTCVCVSPLLSLLVYAYCLAFQLLSSPKNNVTSLSTVYGDHNWIHIAGAGSRLVNHKSPLKQEKHLGNKTYVACLSPIRLIWPHTLNRIAYKQKEFLTVLDVGKSKIRVSARSCSHRGSLSGCWQQLLAASSRGRRGCEFSGVSIMRTLILFIRTPPSWPPASNNITLGTRVSAYKFSWGTQILRPILLRNILF